MYQIFPDEVLGSGQFGIVYGGKGLTLHRWSLVVDSVQILSFFGPTV